jgi:hypothetical protein
VVDTGLFASDVLSTFDKLTIDLVIPVNNTTTNKALAFTLPITSNLSV